MNNNIPSDPARPLGRPLTSDDDDGRWDNKWWPLKGSADNSWMFQGEFREREKGQTPDVIDRGKTDDDDDLWMNDDDDDDSKWIFTNIWHSIWMENGKDSNEEKSKIFVQKITFSNNVDQIFPIL